MQTGISVADALALVLDSARPLAGEVVPCADALGRVLAAPVVAGRTLPPLACSAMDGYAVRAAELTGARAEAPALLRVAGEIAAGAASAPPLAPGSAARIFTGAPLPPGADTIVCQEDARAAGEKRIAVSAPPPPGAHVRHAGEDVREGDEVLAVGARLGPAALGLLAALGRSQVCVRARPRVALVSGGDELMEPDGVPARGRIVASNAYALAAQCREAGAVPVNLGIARDAPDALAALLAAGAGADVLVSSAGVSVGDHDHLRPALEKLGCRLAFFGVQMKPGYPLAFGNFPAPNVASPAVATDAAARGTLVFGLPGNPVSALVCFEQFVRPVLLRMAGYARTGRPLVRAVLTETLRKPRGRLHFVRVRLRREAGRVFATSTGNQSSGALAGLARAQGLLLFDADATELAAGSEARVQVLDADFLREACA